MNFASVKMENGKVLDGKKIGELVKFIINKFSEEKLSCDESKIILDSANSIIGEYSLVQSMD
ncbi:MAG: hypothetical protein ACI4C1_06970 [Lachnospiraceae bacterium]